nr:hypothetical protein [Paenibacillus polymyxa]
MSIDLAPTAKIPVVALYMSAWIEMLRNRSNASVGQAVALYMSAWIEIH